MNITIVKSLVKMFGIIHKDFTFETVQMTPENIVKVTTDNGSTFTITVKEDGCITCEATDLPPVAEGFEGMLAHGLRLSGIKINEDNYIFDYYLITQGELVDTFLVRLSSGEKYYVDFNFEGDKYYDCVKVEAL